MPTNFLQHNPSKANQEDDAAYAGDAFRSGGGPTDGLVPSLFLNKILYQLTTFVAAFAQALQAKNIVITDENISDLAGLLGEIIVASDLTPYALLASPTFTGVPKTPTPAAGDASTQIPNTAWVSGQHSFATPSGYQVLPSGLILQWCQGTQATGDNTQTVSFPLQFPHVCLHVQTSAKNDSGTNIVKVWGVNSYSASGVTVQLMRRGDEGSFAVTPLVFAIGY